MSRSAALTAVLAAALSLSAAHPALAAPPSADWLPGVADSAALATPAVLTGHLSTADGDDFPSGAAVELVAYPSSDLTSTLVVGDDVQVTPIAKGFVTKNGTFTLRLPRGTDVSRFESASGSVDLEVRATSGDYYAAYSLSSSADDLNDLAASRRSTPVRSGINVQSLPANAAVRTLESARTSALNKTDVCGETLVTNYGAKAVTVAGTYTGGAGMTGAATYSSGSSSSLGVGYSASGAYGSYSASGTLSRSSTATVGFGGGTGGREYRTYFNYGKYSQWCYPVSNPAAKNVYAYKVHVSSYAGGGTTVSATVPSTSDSNCVPLSNGNSFIRSSEAAGTYSSGASLSDVIGVNLSSQTGYSTSTSLTYTNSSGVSRRVCGTNTTPASAARIVLR